MPGSSGTAVGSTTVAISGWPFARSHRPNLARGESGPVGADNAAKTAREITETANTIARDIGRTRRDVR
jgi:hypothetical protein